MNPREVVVSGVGVVSAHGIGLDALVEGGRGNRRSLSPLPFPAEGFPFTDGGVCRDLVPKEFVLRRKDIKLMSRDAQLAVAAGVLAMDDAGLPIPPEGEADDGLGIFVGVGHEKGEVEDVAPAAYASSRGGRLSVDLLAAHGLDLMNPLSSLKTLPNMPLAHVAIRVGARGPNLALSSDERGARQALQEGRWSVASGECDRALVGGTDSLTTLAGFCLAWRQRRLGPGLPPGEGAAFVLIECAEVAHARGAKPYRRGELGAPLSPYIGYAGAATPALEEAAAYGLGGRA